METKLTEQQINEIEARANAATPGPWIQTDQEYPSYHICSCGEDLSGNEHGVTQENIDPEFTSPFSDAAFIAASRTDIPALVSDWRALRAECDSVTKKFVEVCECLDLTDKALGGLLQAAGFPDGNPSVVAQYIVMQKNDAAALRAEVGRLTAERDAAIETFDHYRSTHIDRSLEINQLQREIAYLRSTDHAVDVAIETQEYDAETPLGQALDGAGDEG